MLRVGAGEPVSVRTSWQGRAGGTYISVINSPDIPLLKEPPNPRMKRPAKYMLDPLEKALSSAPTISITQPIIMGHLRPYLSAKKGLHVVSFVSWWIGRYILHHPETSQGPNVQHGHHETESATVRVIEAGLPLVHDLRIVHELPIFDFYFSSLS